MEDKINRKLVNYILMIVLVLLVIYFLRYTTLITKIWSILIALIPFYIGFFLSWLLTPVAKFFNTKFKINIKFANALSLLLSIFILLFFIFVIIPLALLQAADLLKSIPEIWNQFTNRLPNNFIITSDQVNQVMSYFDISYTDIITYIKDYVLVIGNGIAFVLERFISMGLFVAQIVFAYIIAFYFMGSIRGFVKGVVNLVEIGDKRKNHKLILEMSKMLFSYIRGLVIVCTVVAFGVTIGSAVIGIKAPLVFGLISGVTNVIPYLGPILGGIPLFIVALSIGYKQAILSILLIILVQFIESNFLQPKIMSQATSLHPVTIMIGLLVFGSLFGVIGMVIATPILSMFNVWLKQSKYKDKITI